MNKLKIRASVVWSAKRKNNIKLSLPLNVVLIPRFFDKKRRKSCGKIVFYITGFRLRVHSRTSARRPELITAVRTSC